MVHLFIRRKGLVNIGVSCYIVRKHCHSKMDATINKTHILNDFAFLRKTKRSVFINT